MANKDFIFETTVYLGDANIYGTAYFAKYFEWQGKAREAFFIKLIPDFSEFGKEVKLITIEAQTSYKKEAALFDDIIIKLNIANIRITTFELIFTYTSKKTGLVAATGKQKIGFTDMNDKVIPIPKELIGAWLKYSSDN